MKLALPKDILTWKARGLESTVIIDTDRPTITPGPKEHESNSKVEIADWSIYAN